MNAEIFVDCKILPTIYMVSNRGRIFGKRSGKILTTSLNSRGYNSISTRIGGRQGKCITLKVSRMVASAFIENPLNKPVVNHIDGNKLNDSVDNLEWTTHSENTIHAINTGLITFDHLKGFKSERNKLAEKSAFDIVKLHFIDKLSMRKIGKMYGVHHTTVSRIIKETIPS